MPATYTARQEGRIQMIRKWATVILFAFSAVSAIAGPSFDLKMLVTSKTGERTGKAIIEEKGKPKLFVVFDCEQSAPLGKLTLNTTFMARYDMETQGIIHVEVSRAGNAREVTCTYKLQE
jgi:hypothetical protein